MTNIVHIYILDQVKTEIREGLFIERTLILITIDMVLMGEVHFLVHY